MSYYAMGSGLGSVGCGTGSHASTGPWPEEPPGCICDSGYACSGSTNQWGQCEGSCVLVAQKPSSYPGSGYTPPAEEGYGTRYPSEDASSGGDDSSWWSSGDGGSSSGSGGGGYGPYPDSGSTRASALGSFGGAFLLAGLAIAAGLYFYR